MAADAFLRSPYATGEPDDSPMGQVRLIVNMFINILVLLLLLLLLRIRIGRLEARSCALYTIPGGYPVPWAFRRVGGNWRRPYGLAFTRDCQYQYQYWKKKKRGGFGGKPYTAGFNPTQVFANLESQIRRRGIDWNRKQPPALARVDRPALFSLYRPAHVCRTVSTRR